MWLTDWHRAKLEAEKGGGPAVDALFDDWLPTNPKAARTLFMLMESTDWRHLPMDGGWLDQDECLMEDVALLSQMSQLVRSEVRGNAGNE